MKFTLAVAAALILACSVGAQVIPATNKVDFTPNRFVGIQGGIPTWPIWTNAHDAGIDWGDVTNMWPILEELIKACPPSNRIHFATNPATGLARYYSTSPITFAGSNGLTRSDIALTADGMDRVRFRFKTVGANALINAGDYSGSFSYGGHSITGGLAQFSTNLFLPDVTGLEVGDSGWISCLYDLPDLVVMSTANYRRIFGQMAQITAIDGNMVSINMPLVWTYPTNNFPTFRKSAYTSGQIGLEGMEIYHDPDSESGMTFLFSEVKNVWLKGVRHTNAPDGNSYVFNCQHISNYEIRGCEFIGSLTAGANNAEIIMANSSGGLIIDNYFEQGGPPIEFQQETYSVVAYNWFTNEIGQTPYSGYSIINHGPHSMMIAVVGNKGVKVLPNDGYFGSSSHWIIEENVLHGESQIADPDNDWMQHPLNFGRWSTHNYLQRNILGSSNLTYYAFNPTNIYHDPTSNYVARFGYPSMAHGAFASNSITPHVDYRWVGEDFGSGENFRPTFVTVLTNSGTGFRIPGVFTNLKAGEQLLIRSASNPLFWYPRFDGNTNYAAIEDGTDHVILTNRVDGHAYMSWTNGDSVYSIGQHDNVPYPMMIMTLADSNTVVFHGNYDYFHQDRVWDASIDDRSYSNILGYNSRQSFMTNYLGQPLMYPLIDPDTLFVNVLPAESRRYRTAGVLAADAGGGTSLRRVKAKGVIIR